MIGNLIARIRNDRNYTKTTLSKMTGMNIGHLTHIEKEERNPSHKTLRTLCDSLEVPVQPLLYTYDRELTPEQESYNIVDHIKYDSIPIVSSILGYANCPKEVRNATFVIRSFDNSMTPKIEDSDFVYVELNAPLNNKDIGLFEYQGKLIIRKFLIRKNNIVLRAVNPDIEDISVSKDSPFFIIGKILGKNNKTMSEYVSF